MATAADPAKSLNRAPSSLRYVKPAAQILISDTQRQKYRLASESGLFGRGDRIGSLRLVLRTRSIAPLLRCATSNLLRRFSSLTPSDKNTDSQASLGYLVGVTGLAACGWSCGLAQSRPFSAALRQTCCADSHL